ncbi:MAG: SEC-C metal-binding domain-containing protein, partial [Acidimicrobiales bacterium]
RRPDHLGPGAGLHRDGGRGHRPRAGGGIKGKRRKRGGPCPAERQKAARQAARAEAESNLAQLYGTEEAAAMATRPTLGSFREGRNDPCRCASGKKAKECCGVQRAPVEDPSPPPPPPAAPMSPEAPEQGSKRSVPPLERPDGPNPWTALKTLLAPPPKPRPPRDP